MVHKTMRGKPIDMDKLARQHELMPAIGNMKVNARGDKLGAGGEIIKKREEIVAEYYQHNPKARVEVKQQETVPAVEPEAIKPASTAPKKVPASE
jgi:hypothetical protein